MVFMPVVGLSVADVKVEGIGRVGGFSGMRTGRRHVG